jgi:hypothetical protein
MAGALTASHEIAVRGAAGVSDHARLSVALVTAQAALTASGPLDNAWALSGTAGWRPGTSRTPIS